MSLASHSALNYTSDMFGYLTYYYVFKNGSEANVVRHSEDEHGRLIYDVFYTRKGESHKMLRLYKDSVLLLLDDLDKEGEACGTVRV